MVPIIYIVLATAMFFFQDTYFTLGGIALSLKNPCALGILFLALLNFTATVRLGRTIVLARHAVTQMLPCIIPFFFSSIIWVASGADAAMILNGIGMIIPQLLAVCVAAATLYLFGSKGIWYCLGAMCAGNLLMVLVVIQEGGFRAFLQEFYMLLVTFCAETGPLMQQLEVHDLTFAFGPFLLYLLLERKEIPHARLWLLMAILFFLIGLKRIAIPAILLSYIVALLLRLLPEKAAGQAALCMAVAMMLIAFLYIAGIRYGLFQYLEEKLQINTMGRVNMFRNLEPYYDISITYMGKGTGFERFVDWASGEVYQMPQRDIMQIHNDFLRMYLNIGFAGFWVWLWGYLTVRLRYWFHHGGKNAGCLFLGICIYCFALYATDNTIYYPYTLLACSLLPMSCRLEMLEDTAIKERCAQWSRKGGEEETPLLDSNAGNGR